MRFGTEWESAIRKLADQQASGPIRATLSHPQDAFHWALVAVEPSLAAIKRSSGAADGLLRLKTATRSRFVRELRLAHKFGTPALMLVGFIYQMGGEHRWKQWLEPDKKPSKHPMIKRFAELGANEHG